MRSSEGDGGILRKSGGGVCRHNGLFVAIATVAENRDGIGQAVRRFRTRTRWRGYAWGRSHKMAGYADGVPCRSALRLPPSRRAGPRLRASVLAAAHATVPPDRYGARRSAALRGAGAWAMRDAAMAYTCARSTRSMRLMALPGACMTRCTHLRPGGSGGCSDVIHAPGRGGLGGAAHLEAGCRSVAAPLSNRLGLGVPATPPVCERLGRAPEGSAERAGEQPAQAEGGSEQAGGCQEYGEDGEDARGADGASGGLGAPVAGAVGGGHGRSFLGVV